MPVLLRQVKDWSTKLYMSSELALQVAYYNETLAVWEPLVEPVEGAVGGGAGGGSKQQRHRPWEISIEVTNNAGDLTEDNEDVVDVITNQPPRFSVSVKSTDVLPITVTKTGLEVISKLGKV